MKKKTFWKDIRKSIISSKARFLSIMLLMALGSFALVGLKVATPNMQTSANDYLEKYNTMDLSVIASYGLSQDDQKELNQIDNAEVEYGYMTDVTVKNTDDAIRVFSNSKDISTYQLVSGEFPTTSSEIALASSLEDKYKIDDTMTFTQGENGIFKETTYKIVGFVNSPEIWSTTSLGSSSAGDGTLSSYAVVNEAAFDSDVYTIARLAYNDLDGLNSFSDDYSKKLVKHQDDLDNVIADNEEKRLEALQSSAQESVDASQNQVDTAKTQLASQSAMLAQLSGQQLAAAQQSIAEAQAQIDANQEKINQAQADIDAMIKPTYNSYNRSTLPGGQGYQTYSSGTNSISAVGNIFPVVLYLVAALVTFTTMTRFVDEERTNSGVLKALGYTNNDVIKKFVIYGFVAGLLGTIIGVLGGTYFLSKMIADILLTSLTIGKTSLYFYWSYVGLSIVLALVSAVLPAYLVARRELSEKPSQLLLPKPPVKGSKILLERVGFIWKQLSFTHKVTARNIFRYKQRMLMTVFGVAGSVALLFAGLGIQSSLNRVITNQFTTLTPYDMLVVKNNSADATEEAQVTDYLKTDIIKDSLGIHYTNIAEDISGVTDKQSISILVNKSRNFGDFIHLINVDDGKEINLSNDGVVITEKLASLYHVKVGDDVTIKDTNEKDIKLHVSAIVENNVGHYLYMTDTYYEETFGGDDTINAYLVNLKNNSSENISAISTELLTMTGVSAISQNSSLVDTVHAVVNSLNSVMTLLVVLAVMLAVVILYNLTNINIAERIRELSTIKVLGFYNKEVTMYIYRETISLSLIGIIVGLIGGKFLHQLIMSMIGSDSMTFGTLVDWTIYVIPIVAITLILTLLGWLVNHKLKNVDMLEALKSVD